MTAASAPAHPPPTLIPHRLVVRALLLAVPMLAAGCALALLSGIVPVDAQLHVGIGAGLAIATGAATAVLQARAVAAPPGRPAEAQQFQVALAAGFVIPMFVVGAGLLLLSQSGVKFESLAAFGLTFAAGVLALQLTAAVVFGRALRARALLRQQSAATKHPPEPRQAGNASMQPTHRDELRRDATGPLPRGTH